MEMQLQKDVTQASRKIDNITKLPKAAITARLKPMGKTCTDA